MGCRSQLKIYHLKLSERSQADKVQADQERLALMGEVAQGVDKNPQLPGTRPAAEEAKTAAAAEELLDRRLDMLPCLLGLGRLLIEPLLLLTDQAAEMLEQFFQGGSFHRLRQVVVEPRFGRAPAIFILSIAGQGHEHDRAPVLSA